MFKKIIAEKFYNLEKEIVNQVQEAQRIPGRKNLRKNTPRHIIIKLTKIKERDKLLKAKGGKKDNIQGNSYHPISLFLNRNSKTLQL